MNDGAVTPSSLVQSVGLGQFNCRRLWGRHDAVHDGFMELVSCLNHLGLHIICVQQIQSPPMDPLAPTDGRLGFLFHSSVDACPVPGITDRQSLRWRLVAGATCVCSFYAPHAGITLFSLSTRRRRMHDSGPTEHLVSSAGRARLSAGRVPRKRSH